MVTTWKIGAAALLIFAAGVATGGFTVWATLRNPQRPSVPLRVALTLGGSTNRVGTKPPGLQRLEVYRRICAQLDVPPEKRQHLESLIDETSVKIQALWNPVAPRLQQEIRELRHRIEAELPTDQKERFESLAGHKASVSAPSSAEAK